MPNVFVIYKIQASAAQLLPGAGNWWEGGKKEGGKKGGGGKEGGKKGGGRKEGGKKGRRN